MISLLLTKRGKQFLIYSVFASLLFILGYGAVKSGLFDAHHPAARVYSLIDSNLADETGAEGTMDWREKMWSIAWEKAKSKPLGHGFVSKSISDVLRFNYTVGREVKWIEFCTS